MTTEVMPSDSVRVRPEPPAILVRLGLDVCGHCKTGHHKSCKGAVRLPKSSSHPSGLLICYCGDCESQIRCLDCGNQFSADVNSNNWSCWDPAMCRGRVLLRLKNDRLWRLIQECKTTAARQRREDRLRRLAIRSQVGGEEPDRVAKRGSRPTSGQCHCCGAPTKGGEFAPGHDAKHKSKLRKDSDSGDKSAYKELVERGWV